MPISSDPSRILIIRPAAPADLCRSVPLAASLRRAFPEATIHWLARQSTTPMLEAHPAIDEIITLSDEPAPPRRWHRGLMPPAKVRELLRHLRQQQYDLVLDAHGRAGSGRYARATRAVRRIGPHDAALIERLGYTARPDAPPPADSHHIERLLTLLKPIGIDPVIDTRLCRRDEDIQWWAQRHGELGIESDHEPYAVIAPATTDPAKRWPLQRWTELIGPILHRDFRRVIMIGSASCRDQLNPLRDIAAQLIEEGDGRFIDMAGETDIGQMMAVIGGAGLVIANDTAPLHIAAGLNRPCLGLFGPTDPALTGPYGRKRAALRVFTPRPDELISPTDPKLGDALMRVISTAAVIQALDRVLADAGDVQGERNEPCPIGSEDAPR